MKRKIFGAMSIMAGITLVLSVVFTLIISYGRFSYQYKNAIKNEAALIAADMEPKADKIARLESLKDLTKNRITLISPNGEVLFDSEITNLQNHSNRPEVIEAQNKGAGDSERLSTSLSEKTYYRALRLSDGSVLRLASTTDSVFSAFIDIIPAAMLIAGGVFILIFLMSAAFSRRFATKIESIDPEDPKTAAGFDELSPFLLKISRQNESIKERAAQIEAHKNQLDIISRGMNEGLVTLDRNGLIISINDSAVKIFSSDNVLGKSFLYLCHDLEITESIKAALKGNKKSKIVSIGKKEYQLFLNPVLGDDEAGGVIMLLFDVSHRQQAEKMRREFSANVSHELKTPLTTVLGYAQMIANGMAKEEDVKLFAHKIEKEASRLIALINDIIKISNLDEGGFMDDFGPVDLFSLAKTVLEDLSPQISQKCIGANLHGHEAVVQGSPSMLYELVYNLCDNAIKYNHEGGKLIVTVSCENGKPQLIVSDTGIGIPEKYRERIFERFFTIDKSRSQKTGGTGLGLSIAKHTTLTHNANIYVEGTPGGGSTFVVEF